MSRKTLVWDFTCLFIFYTHTHTNTHTHARARVCMCVSVYFNCIYLVVFILILILTFSHTHACTYAKILFVKIEKQKKPRRNSSVYKGFSSQSMPSVGLPCFRPLIVAPN